MKKIVIVLLSVLVLASLVSAQENVTKTKAGDKAMLFSFSGLSNLSLGGLDGGVGFKYYFQDNMALRGGISGNYVSSKLKGVAPAKDINSDSIHLSFSPSLIYNFASSTNVTAYVGGTATFFWAHSHYDNPTIDFGGEPLTVDELKYQSASFGIGALAGVEWFPWENISVSGEYNLVLNMTSSSVEAKLATVNYAIDFPSTTTFGFNSAATLSLGIYF